MHASFVRLTTLFALLFALCGVLASPVTVPEAEPAVAATSLELERDESSELAERSAMRTGGKGTYFYPGLGACGWTNKNSDMIVAISTPLFKGKHCGKYITITSRGKTQRAKVVDECPGCAENSLDMSPSLFKHFASESVGVIAVKWKFD